MIIKDSMVVIHLAKLSVLEKSCEYFKDVLLPEKVYGEISKGKEKFPEVAIIEDLIKEKKIMLKEVKDQQLIKKAYQFNIQHGEAEVVALYWQEKAELLATDDDNVRKKKILLDLKIIGTPIIVLKLYKNKMFSKNKIKECISELKKIGWFNNSVLDKLLMEVENG